VTAPPNCLLPPLLLLLLLLLLVELPDIPASCTVARILSVGSALPSPLLLRIRGGLAALLGFTPGGKTTNTTSSTLVFPLSFVTVRLAV
jgi:hypothetical protein